MRPSQHHATCHHDRHSFHDASESRGSDEGAPVREGRLGRGSVHRHGWPPRIQSGVALHWRGRRRGRAALTTAVALSAITNVALGGFAATVAPPPPRP